ncbi:MAG TPA: penicillin-binding protein activator [Novosphingobium sp.]|nr:penicillin-binding protein activator [Novosphingobium sp.]
MIEYRQMWRAAAAVATSAMLAACAVIPKAPVVAPPPAPPPPQAALPTDTGRHRVALLVPTSGPNAAAGQSLANAATMALMDLNATDLRITTYDTGGGAAAAAAHAVAEGNRLILGPLLGEEAHDVAAVAQRSHIPVISFSNDAQVAGDDLFVMGTIPAQSVARVVRYARAQGATRFAALVPVGVYGERVSNAMIAAVRASGGQLVGMESYDRAGGTLAAAVRRLRARGPVDAVLVGDTARMAAQAAPLIRVGNAQVHILGTELWNGDASVARTPALSGAWYAALSDQRFRRFSETYKGRFGAAPYRIATMGYDSVLLSLRIARDWRPGTAFPTARLYDRGGFLGLDGIFRFSSNDVIERALEVREAKGGAVRVASPAPARFDD